MTEFLFSVDVEDLRDRLPGGGRLPERVPELVDRYLRFLREHEGTGTFFLVGQVARRHPDVVRSIMAEGHEIGCHSDMHIELDRLDPVTFRDDTLRALEAIRNAGGPAVRGYRAPCFSLTGRTSWAYEVLGLLGFQYSSSVLPATSPVHGWPSFGRIPKQVEGGLWEIPVSLLPFPMPPLPAAGGVYFRALPKWMILRALRSARRGGRPLAGYFHPYDIDTRQAVALPGHSPFGLVSWLMNRNRHKLFDRLELASRLGFHFATFGRYAERLRTRESGCDE